MSSEHGKVLQVAGTLFKDTPNLDLDAIKSSKKSVLIDKRE